MEKLKETIKLRGSSGKVIELTYEELLKKKINGKIEFKNGKYYAKITRWYSLEKAYDSLNEATSNLIKIIQKIDTLKILIIFE